MADGTQYNLTPMQAWKVISAALKELYHRRAESGQEPYDQSEIKAEVICYQALKEMEGKSDGR